MLFRSEFSPRRIAGHPHGGKKVGVSIAVKDQFAAIAVGSQRAVGRDVETRILGIGYPDVIFVSGRDNLVPGGQGLSVHQESEWTVDHPCLQALSDPSTPTPP